MNILIVVAHPDDEVLGCGGAIARHAAAGDKVYILIMSEGAMSRVGVDSKERTQLVEAAVCAAKILGAEPPTLIGLPDNRLDSIALLDVIKKIEESIAKISPTVVYTHQGNDLNQDHRVVHQATITACRPVPGSVVNRVLGFETLSSTEWSSKSFGLPFNPTHFLDISANLSTKLAALKCYKNEMREFPHPRSIEAVCALAQLRGSHSGTIAAEAFEIYLDICHA